MLWNDDWLFALLPPGSGYADWQKAEKRSVILPHDWLIEDTGDLYRSGDGWYAKHLHFEPDGMNVGRLYLDFDGVYLDADVLVNGRMIRTHRYGYTAFLIDLTDHLRPGDNEISVHVRYQSPNSRWYSGAGIFRDVRLLSVPRRHLAPFGVSVRTAREGEAWRLDVRAEISGKGNAFPFAALKNQEGRVYPAGQTQADENGCRITWRLEGIRPWSPEDPYLYELTLDMDGQTEEIAVGFRETRFDPKEGFFLNGRHVKLHGVCLHHDLGLLGAAFYEKAAERQLLLMRKMGANAIRTAHNPPARAFLDLCDRMGFLVIDELFDMWEEPKTPFDNARFFPDTWRESVAEWVRRDRCHPSVILWSIGNEIHDVFSERGPLWAERLTEETRRHDPDHAAVTFGSNYMPWEGGQKCADIFKIAGYNYAEKHYEEHHQRHPDWVIYGSETGSHLQSRGVYHFPMDAHILCEEDLQCSALLNSTTSWGTQNLPQMLTDDAATPYSMGQFIWAGIDYLGEPTPYHTRNCYFGQADTACFPKDSYYFYQAMWTDKPMLHIGMIWDWNEDQLIDVPVMTNGAFAELFLNGRSLGRKRVDRRDPALCLPRWSVLYEKGTLFARAYDEQGRIVAEEEKSSFGEGCSIALTAERQTLKTGCGDIAFVEAAVLDERGVLVENAVNRVHAEVCGAGVLLGMDNGDSTDPDSYRTDSRRLFNGKLLMMIGAGEEAGEIAIRVWGKGLKEARLSLTVRENEKPCEVRRFRNLCSPWAGEDGCFVRRIDLKLLDDDLLEPSYPKTRLCVHALPAEAEGQPLCARITNEQGVDVPFAKAEWTGPNELTVTACGDGEMYVRVTAANGAEHARIISVLELTAEGFGVMNLDPYRFIAGALYSDAVGEITPGNEQGVSFSREGFSAVGFSPVDFGPVGSDELTLPVFALNDDRYEITLWDGRPLADGRVIAVLPYQKKSVWNVYQEATYRLPEVLTGVHSLYFSMNSKAHLKGFSFTRQSRVGRYIRAVDAESLYGDSFRRDPDAVRGIGNNVTLGFEHFVFPRAGKMHLMLEGSTPLAVNPVAVRFSQADGSESTSLCPFVRAERTKRQMFSVTVPQGESSVSFIFLPGSRFDFVGFQFTEMRETQKGVKET